MLEENEVKTVLDNPTVLVEFEGVGSEYAVVVHVTSKLSSNLTKDVYEGWLLDFEIVKQTAYDMGYDYLMVSYGSPDVKVKKFWRMFGFDVMTHGVGMIGFMPTEEVWRN